MSGAAAYALMPIYNVWGYSLIGLHVLAAGLLAPPHWGLLDGAAGGFLYLVLVWFVGGVYLSDVLHMGVAHRALAYRPWFIQAVTLLNNTVGVYVNPATWVNRHRHHHAFSDRAGIPTSTPRTVSGRPPISAWSRTRAPTTWRPTRS